jgi:hypothetical protein
LTYTAQVTNPLTWEPEFLKALVGALAQKLSFALMRSTEVVKARVSLEQADKMNGMAATDLRPVVLPGTEKTGAA